MLRRVTSQLGETKTEGVAHQWGVKSEVRGG